MKTGVARLSQGATVVLALSLIFPISGHAQSNKGPSKAKVFMTTSTYGVMAGSLVGLASLTFYKQPSKRLRNIAIGASLGLYTGILLGAYMVYFIPDPNAKPAKQSAPAPAAPAAPPASEKPSLDSEDPLNLGDKQGSLERQDLPIEASVDLPALVPVALYDGRHVIVGVDYHF